MFDILKIHIFFIPQNSLNNSKHEEFKGFKRSVFQHKGRSINESITSSRCFSRFLSPLKFGFICKNTENASTHVTENCRKSTVFLSTHVKSVSKDVNKVLFQSVCSFFAELLLHWNSLSHFICNAQLTDPVNNPGFHRHVISAAAAAASLLLCSRFLLS